MKANLGYFGLGDVGGGFGLRSKNSVDELLVGNGWKSSWAPVSIVTPVAIT